MNTIQTIDAEQIAKLTAGKTIPDFAPGDTVRVNVNVTEGERTRVQAFEGVCIARTNRGINPASPCARSPMARAWSACSSSMRRPLRKSR